MAESVIREVNTETELAECVRVLRSAFGTVASDLHITEETAPTNPAFVDLAKMGEYVKRRVSLFGMFAGEQMIGCVAIEKSNTDEATYFIERLAVIPEERHRGHGSALLEHAIEKIYERGGQYVSIGIIDANKVLKDWYARSGFTETGRKRFEHLPFEVCFMKKDIRKQDVSPFFCSWSGGKDSCLALYDTLAKGWTPKVLFTMMREGGEYSRSHGLPASLIELQAKALRIPAVLCASGRDDYEGNFIKVLSSFRKCGIEHGVYGDIDIEEHREWVERASATAGIAAHEPLWREDRLALLGRFIGLGFKATVIAVKRDVLPARYLGRSVDAELVSEFAGMGIDPAGEFGEYHTVVTDGPIFSHSIRFGTKGVIEHDGYLYPETYVMN